MHDKIICSRKAPSSGDAHSCQTDPRSNGSAADRRFFGRRFGSLSVGCHRRRRRQLRPTGVRTVDRKVSSGLHYHSAIVYYGSICPPHCLEPSLPLTKTVCFCPTGHKYHNCSPPPPLNGSSTLFATIYDLFQGPVTGAKDGGRPGKGLQRPPRSASQFPSTQVSASVSRDVPPNWLFRPVTHWLRHHGLVRPHILAYSLSWSNPKFWLTSCHVNLCKPHHSLLNHSPHMCVHSSHICSIWDTATMPASLSHVWFWATASEVPAVLSKSPTVQTVGWYTKRDPIHLLTSPSSLSADST